MLKFVLQNLDDKSIEIDRITSFELVKEIGEACDGLRLSFTIDSEIGEIVSVIVYRDDQIVFDGLCDLQRKTNNKTNNNYFIYARSFAAVLMDNEAQPTTYNCPSSETLFYNNAHKFGFKNGLPKMHINDYYEVQKGKSCYSAINDFVKALSGQEIYVDVDKTIKVLDTTTIVKIDNNTVMDERLIINRGKGISSIDYKLNNGSTYNRHLTSDFLKSRHINRRRLVNLGALSRMQKQMIMKNKMENSVKDYYSVELLLCGFYNFNLAQELSYQSDTLGILENYHICKLVFSKTKDAITTKVCANKSIELEEINYVAE